MKPKILLSAFSLFCFLQHACSQQYHPFLNNSSWILINQVSCCVSPTIRTIDEGTDVVIGNYTYKKFHDTFPHNNHLLTPDETLWTNTLIDTVYIREDVEARKVYHIVNGTDELLYDFTLQTGDIIFQFGYEWEVILVDEVAVDNGARKRITLRTTHYYNGHRYTQKWIEGVGSNSHPFYPQNNMYFVVSPMGDHFTYTKCSFQNGVHVYGDTTYCGAALLGTSEQVYRNGDIAFSPNPFTTQLTINSESALENATFRLYNVQGRLVREINNLNGTRIEVNRGSLNSGLYFAALLENGNLIKTVKLIVE